MVKLSVVVVALAVGGAAWLWQATSPATAQAQSTAAGAAGPEASAAAASQSADAASVAALMASSADTAGSGLRAGTGGAPPTRIADLGLSRQLAGNNSLVMEGRPRTVLGSKEIAGPGGAAETLLVIRDEVSGQLTYHRAGLQFALKDESAYEAFIREHPRMRRIFVNPLYAQVAVDTADIADEYSALAHDDRVTKLRFMSVAPVIKPK